MHKYFDEILHKLCPTFLMSSFTYTVSQSCLYILQINVSFHPFLKGIYDVAGLKIMMRYEYL